MTDLTASSIPAPARGLPTRLLGDERLARLAAAGSERAFAVLYERHHQALYRYCRAIVRHDEDAQDVLQTTMARALAALGRRVPDAPMRPWLFRIAHNEAVSLLRRRRATVRLEQAPEIEAPRLEGQVEERSRLAALVADLWQLPDRQRSALVMRELSGLSHEEIAAALGISAPAAKQAIFEARTGLQEFAKGRAMDCADVQLIVSARDGRMLRGRPLRAHLRSCAPCHALRDAIGTRRSDLAAIAPPLPAAAATGLLSSILGGGHGGGAGSLASGIAAKVSTGALTAKALAGVAVVATVAVGTTQVVPRAHAPRTRESRGLAAPAAAAPDSTAAARTSAVQAGAARASDAASAARPTRGTPNAPTPPAHRAAAAHGAVSTGARRHASSSGEATGVGRALGAASNGDAGGRPPSSRPAAGARPHTPTQRGGHRPTNPAARAPSRPSPPATPAPAAPAHPATLAPTAGRPSIGTTAARMPTGGRSPDATSAASPAPPAAPAASTQEVSAPAVRTPAAAASDVTPQRSG